MPLIPQSVAGDVLMDFDSLKAAQSGLGTVRSGFYYFLLTPCVVVLLSALRPAMAPGHPCILPWPVII